MRLSVTSRGRYSRAVRRSAFAVALLTLSALFASGCPKDSTPPANVAAFTVTATNSRIDLSWTNPADSDFGGVRIQRQTGAYPASPSDGTTIYSGNGTSAADAGLQNGTPYFYTAFAYDAVPNYASGVHASAIPTTAMAHGEILQEFQEVRDALKGPGAISAPAEQVAVLSDRLERAEQSYRGGDPCGAADHLMAYQDAAQADRQGAAAGVFEDLYNLGRRLRYDMLANMPRKDLCPGQERIGMLAGETLDDTANDNTQLKLAFELGEPKLATLNEAGEVFTQLNIPESPNAYGPQWGGGPAGQPAVPVFRRLLGVPRGAEVSLEYATQEAETLHCNLVPAQESPVDEIAMPDPSTFADPAFVKDAQAYASDAPFPSVPCRLVEAGQMRDLRIAVLEIAAGQYNPKTQTLTLFKRVDVHVAFTGGTGFLASQSLNPFDGTSARYAGAAINRAAILKYADAVPINPSRPGEEFMILTPPSLLGAAQTLQTWKNQKGILTDIFQVGPGTGYETNAQIRDLIKAEFDSSAIRPSYVLLLGDADLIPPFYETPNAGADGTPIGTDYPYATFTGSNALLPNVALGRIPVSALADANAVVNKIVAYEKAPPGADNAAFYLKAAIASVFQCCRTGSGAAGADQRAFVETSEFARNTLIGAGYLVDRIYGETIDSAYTGSSVPARYYDGTLLTSDIGSGSGFAWDGSANDVSTAINNGRFLVIHRDHGWPGGWGTPHFDTAAAYGLLNGNLLPVVFSVDCASAYFDGETSGGALGVPETEASFAEALLRNPNGGAAGILGCTRNSPTWANDALLRGFIDAIWPGALPGFGDSTSHRRLGDILNLGKLHLLTQCGAPNASACGDALRLWHCIGDPTLEIWTQFPYEQELPATLAATYLQTGIKVEYPVNGAEITAFQALPIGRGIVKDGVATLDYVNAQNREAPVQFSVNVEGALPVIVSQTPGAQ